jgi:hypothetical protein
MGESLKGATMAPTSRVYPESGEQRDSSSHGVPERHTREAHPTGVTDGRPLSPGTRTAPRGSLGGPFDVRKPVWRDGV